MLKRIHLSIFIFSIALACFSPVHAQTFDVDTIVYNGNPNKFINLVFLGDGYEEIELGDFVQDVQNVSDYIFTTSPFSEYQNYFNVFAISVPSAESGTDHPGTATDVSEPVFPVESVNTYFNSTFDYAAIHRLLVATNGAAINSVLSQNFPLYDQVLILVNSPNYGGSGGSRAVGSLHSSAPEIMLHEMGHSFGGLADEYYAGDQYANERPNMTQETNPLQVKWKNWMDDLGIGIYQHCCGGNSAEWYRPHQGCKMRALGTQYPFCSVCKETIIEKVHQLFGIPVTSYEPPENTVSLCGQPVDFLLNVVAPVPNTLSITWKLNGTEIATDVDGLTITSSQLNPGNNTLTAAIVDDTDLSRSDSHAANHTYTVSWTLNYEPLEEPEVTADGPLDFCEGDQVTLMSTESVMYEWSNGETTQNINVIETGTYIVTITNAYGCTATSLPVEVNVEEIPEAIILEGPLISVCPGEPVTLTAGPADLYFWNTGESAQSITVFEPGNYTVTVENALGCSAVSLPATVVHFAPPDATIDPEEPGFCEGDSIVLGTGVGVNYLWSNGSTDQTILVTVEGFYSVTVTSAEGCTASAEIYVEVGPVPEVGITTDGPTTICAGDSVTLVSSPADTWLWSNGATSREITTGTEGSYNVTVTMDGCAAASDSIAVMVQVPEFTVSADGSLAFCAGDSVQLTASASQVYLWSTGDTTQSILVTESGMYYLTGVDSTGCAGVSDSVFVMVHTPEFTISAEGSLAFCAGDSVLLTASESLAYLWNTGDTTQSILVTESGMYYLTGVDSTGCTGASASLTISVHPLPPVPVITAEGQDLISSATTGNQWYLNGKPIDSATGQLYNPIEDGSFTVAVTDSNGCTAVSEPYLYSTVGLTDPKTQHSVLVIPNPNNGTFMLNTEGIPVEKITIRDMTGVVVYQTTVPTETIDLSNQHKGIYFMTVHIENLIYPKKLILQ